MSEQRAVGHSKDTSARGRPCLSGRTPQSEASPATRTSLAASCVLSVLESARDEVLWAWVVPLLLLTLPSPGCHGGLILLKRRIRGSGGWRAQGHRLSPWDRRGLSRHAGLSDGSDLPGRPWPRSCIRDEPAGPGEASVLQQLRSRQALA